ncbi:hypothetical protein BJY52DRAFT_502159 [Lactarius psammicola]|nr:hypothetical protein BJY52DRAFT_502159 [Lactarius psammicola]
MGLFGSSKNSPSWTPGSFPGPMPVVVQGYPYSSSPVWQAQPVMTFPSYPSYPTVMPIQVPVPVQVPVQVPVPVPVPVPTPVAFSSPALPPATTYTVGQPTPSTNTLLFHVPSPRITPIAPPPADPPTHSHYRSPRPPPPPSPAPDQWSQPQVYSVPQQQGQSSPINIIVLQTPQQGQSPLPQVTPAVLMTDDDEASSGDDSASQDDPHHDHNHDHDHDIQKPKPTPSPNTPRPLVPNLNISISSTPHPMLSALVLSSPLPPAPDFVSLLRRNAQRGDVMWC